MSIEDLLDKEAIKTLRYRYSQLADAGRLGEVADLFTADAICDLGPSYGGPWRGRDEIRERYLSFSAMAIVPNEVMHVVTNPEIELLSAGVARGRWYLQSFLAKEGLEQPILGLGYYEDLYAREDDVWRFSSLKLNMLWPQRHIFQD